MEKEKVFAMKFAKVYPCLIQKAERKGRTRKEVYEVTSWMTGYTKEQLESFLASEQSYGAFFQNAPKINPAYEQIRGRICGVKIEEIKDPLMRQIRCLDKLVDELAKGKSMEKLLQRF